MEGRVAIRLAEGNELVAKDLEACLTHEPRVCLAREAREERRRTKEIPCPGLSVTCSKSGHEQTARHEPAVDPRERQREQLARYVIERIERDDRVERLRLELERREGASASSAAAPNTSW